MRAIRPTRPGASKPVARRDPAPSRLSYRLHRLWLTRRFRLALRVGVPFVLVVGAAQIWLSDPARLAAVQDRWTDLRDSFQERPEFMVTHFAIDGASPVLAEALRGAVVIDLPVSSFRLDLAALRKSVEVFDAVARADVRVAPGGILTIAVTERMPVVVWRDEAGLTLLDATGHRVATLAARDLRADLPLIVGLGADAAVPEALALIAAAGPLAPRIRGLVRVGIRRWDVVLDRDQRILLPADGALTAFERAIALDQAEEVLSRDIVAIDLRLPHRPTLRLSPVGAEVLRQMRLTETGGASL